MEVIWDTRASKGVVHDFYTNYNNKTKKYKEPPFLYETLMDMVEVDPILFRAIDLTSSIVCYKGYDFIGDNDREIKRAKKLFNDELDFDRVIKNVLRQLIIYGDSYLEIVWNKSKSDVKELHPRDTQDVKMDFDKHGTLTRFVETIKGKGEKDNIFYQPDEMVDFHLYQVGSSPYSRCPFKSISRSFATKIYANNYLQSIFLNLPPKLIYFLKNANETQKEDFIQNITRAKTNPNMDIIAQSNDDFRTEVMQVKFDDGLVKVLEYLRKEIIILMGMPPHWVGMMDGANRGIGENVVIPFETKIKDLQHEIASQINRTLMPKLKFSDKIQFKWNAVSLLDEKSILEHMEKLNTVGFDPETIISYARDHGLNLRLGATIEKPDPVAGAFGKPGLPTGKKNPKTDLMGKGLDKKGVSEAGAKKLQEKKVVV